MSEGTMPTKEVAGTLEVAVEKMLDTLSDATLARVAIETLPYEKAYNATDDVEFVAGGVLHTFAIEGLMKRYGGDAEAVARIMTMIRGNMQVEAAVFEHVFGAAFGQKVGAADEEE